MNAATLRYRLVDLSDRFGLELRGDKNHEVTGVGTLSRARPEDISFLANRSYRKQLKSTCAGAVILQPADAKNCPVNCLLSENPRASYARVAALFEHKPVVVAGVHPTAVIDESAHIGDEVHIGPYVVIGAGTHIGTGSSIGPGCVIGDDCQLGDGGLLEANVTLTEGVKIGKRVIIYPGAVIGADGFGLAFSNENWVKVPQLGSVSIGDDCEIGANTTIDRGAIDDTVLEDDVRLDNLVQIGHNTFIGAHTAIAGCCGIAGSTRIGRNCLLGGAVGIAGHVVIADGVTISAKSYVNRDITEKGGVWSSTVPVRPLREWQRSVAHLRKLDQVEKRIRKLEKQAGKSQNNE